MENYKVKNKWFFKIVKELKEDSVFGVWILAIIIIKDLTIPFIIIYGINSPYLQIIPVIIILIFTTIFLIITRPYKNWIKNGVEIFTYIMYIISLILFLILTVLEGRINE